MSLAPRAQRASLTEMTEYVLPPHANALGSVFGGQIMAWIDLCAAICAQRHAGMQCVTATVDDLRFREPVRVGEVAHLTAKVTASFRTSLEITVQVWGEQTTTGRRWPCVDARLTFVGLGADGRPTQVPALLLDSDEIRTSQAEGEARRQARLARDGRVTTARKT